ncbi:MAG TPA: TMEM175 family protein [Polyangiaceae bacterium]|jgi:TMEM175 potassium channel family protein|nr:TMEM175 family protein [Polyangiaceae bacterium]
MTKGRLEAFSDGVIAIIITIMVLELKVPHGSDLHALRPLLPVFLSYVLSFVFIAIYWNNHHHMLHAAERINGNILWANTHLLFWLSLVPFATAWIGESHLAPLPTATYGVVMVGAAIAYTILQILIVRHHGKDHKLGRAIGKNTKERASLALYVAAVPLAFVSSWVSVGIYVAVALIWFVPDRRIESVLNLR